MLKELYFNDTATKRKTIVAYRKGQPITVHITHGYYRGSQGNIDARYIVVDQFENVGFGTNSFVVDFGKEKVRWTVNHSVTWHMQPVTPGNKLKLKKYKRPKAPSHVLDRHGEKLVVGDAVLVARRETFTFGVVDKLTATATIVRNGKTRSRLVHSKRKMAGIVRLDKNLSARFMMEKLAKL